MSKFLAEMANNISLKKLVDSVDELDPHEYDQEFGNGIPYDYAGKTGTMWHHNGNTYFSDNSMAIMGSGQSDDTYVIRGQLVPRETLLKVLKLMDELYGDDEDDF